MRITFSKDIYSDEDYLMVLEDSVDILVSTKCALEALKGIVKESSVEYYLDSLMEGATIDLISLHYGLISEYKTMCEKVGCNVEEFVKRYYDAISKYNSTEKGYMLDGFKYPF